ncbi:MAG: hypothetical protein ACXVCP_04860 [Bdellovibrio sp.]
MKSLLIGLILLLQASLSFGSFDQNSRRYMSYYDVITSMKSIFVGDIQLDNGQIGNDCIQVTDNNSVDLGYNYAATGEPGISSPNPNYVRWMNNCVSSYMKLNYFKTLNESLLLSETGKAFFDEKFKSMGYFTPPFTQYMLDMLKYKDLPEEIQNDLIDYAFSRVFGPEEAFNQFNLMEAKTYKATVKAHLKNHDYAVYKALEVIMANYLMRDEFVSY